MKTKLLLLLPILFLLACKKDANSNKEKIKLYILASTGIYTGNPALLTLSGTNIETLKDFSGSYILDVDYIKGQNQTLTLTSNRKDVDVHITVSKTLSPNDPNNLVDKFGTGSLTVSFVAQ
ncbi:hypothetical protein I5M32_00210 [Pedobacter sp. SD-b]|uniref:Lipoprotein n=1 Tax=Pedobacter segetis TaxID=2793069 RepID=A0ABS1BEZ5_9SPHI|nr:hypothetical protein [Pedobacter segetis]MBK0381366.1 hypothetical protein [Pedobacter segetis]